MYISRAAADPLGPLFPDGDAGVIRGPPKVKVTSGFTRNSSERGAAGTRLYGAFAGLGQR
jgi:hypothetical protein